MRSLPTNISFNLKKKKSKPYLICKQLEKQCLCCIGLALENVVSKFCNLTGISLISANYTDFAYATSHIKLPKYGSTSGATVAIIMFEKNEGG